jgi:hypothetical protein
MALVSRLAALLLLAAGAAAGLDADGYFEAGVVYLKKGFFAHARSAFAESLVRAPGQPVPMAFLALAGVCDGRPPAESATLLRWAHERLPPEKTLRLDLAAVLPSRRVVDLLQGDCRSTLGGARGTARIDLLTVLAFLEVHDGDPAQAPALDTLLREAPADPYAQALARGRSARKDPGAAP